MKKGTRIIAYISATKIEGVIQLIYDEAIASGTNEYVQITMILFSTNEGKVFSIRPRDIVEILKNENPE